MVAKFFDNVLSAFDDRYNDEGRGNGYVPGTVLRSLHALFHDIFTTVLCFVIISLFYNKKLRLGKIK